MEVQTRFSHEIESLPNDESGNKVTKITCHGRVTALNVGELKELVKPLLPAGGRTVVDLGDVDFVDSSGLGALIGLKISAINQGLCILEFVNITAPVLKLLRLANLEKILTS